MKIRFVTSVFIGYVVLLQSCSCNGLMEFTDAVANVSERKKYLRDTQSSQIGEWSAAFESSEKHAVSVVLPYGEKGRFNPIRPFAYSYTFNLVDGESLLVGMNRDLMSERVFFNVFRYDNGQFNAVDAPEFISDEVRFYPESGGLYKIILQPELGAKSDFFLSVRTLPFYSFPVAGKGNSAIQSFWGYERDGGSRKHEGIDIFARRGTPVVAASDGYVTYTGERGRGGKQVWMRSSLNNMSLYYAHLDRIQALDGQQVKSGDTLGYVGSTGNAEGGKPHLHFGIYGFSGAVDPLPYVRQTQNINRFDVPTATLLKVRSVANMRSGPSLGSPVIFQIDKSAQELFPIGRTAEWFHIVLPSGERGFIHESTVKIQS